jgi:uncharacterized oxidoreductase
MPIFTPQQLIDWASDTLQLAGSLENEARLVAENLIEANLKGHDSHGIGMIAQYVAAIAQGGLKPNTTARLRQDNGAILSFDGERGFGQVIGRQTMQAGIDRAKALGVSIISLANSHHLGRIGAWAEQAAAEQLISIHFANVFCKPRVVPWNGVLPRFGTNPFCVGIPRPGQAPLILDFATSVIAGGKARVAYFQGKQLADGQAVDDQGQPTTNPRFLVEEPLGGLLPFGLHKGSGLSLICSLLGAALTGSPTERGAEPGAKAIVNGMLSIVLDPQAFGGLDAFKEEVDALLDWVRESRTDDQLLLPGEPEQAQWLQRSRDGIEIDTGTWSELQAVRQRLHDATLQRVPA